MKPFKTILIGLFCAFPLMMCAAPMTPAPSQSNKAAPPDVVDQEDTTDVFAVPLDSSEEEEEQEEESLEKTQKKMKAGQKTPAAPVQK